MGVKKIKLSIAPNIRKIVILTASSFVCSLLIFLSNVLGLFELKAFDSLSKYLNPAASSDNIVIVQVDQESIDGLSKEGVNWPWPRQIYAPIIDYLSEADAIFVDILFTEASSYGQEDDMVLVDAVKRSCNVYLPVFLSNKTVKMSAGEEEFIRSIAIRENISSNLKFNSAITPIDPLKNSVRGGGNVMIKPDEDGVYRKVPLVFKLEKYQVPNFVIDYLIDDGKIEIVQNRLSVEGSEIPLTDGNLLLRYYRNGNPFKVFSASEILKSYLDVNALKEPPVKRDFFKRKVIFLGLTAAGLYDLKPTSISSISTGVFIHATTLDNILNKSFIRIVNPYLEILFMLLISFFITFTVLKRHSFLINLTLFLVTFSIILLVIVLLFKIAIYVKVIPTITSLILSFMIVVAYSYATEGRQRVLLRKTFSQYMDKKIADYLLENPALIKPGGQKKRVTVFFADIAGFTTMSEKTTPERIASVLHSVLNSLTEVIILNQGVIDKYIGDCVMAFWGAPIDAGNCEINSCYSAIQSMVAIKKMNKELQKEGFPELSIRIGIHSGDAIAGNIGSDRLFHYTVIGDTVNLASRLESVNKFFNTGIIISEDTLRETRNSFITRQLGSIAVKGKTLPVKIYELVGQEQDIEWEMLQLLKIYNDGIQFYNDRKFDDAIHNFNEILTKYPNDGPSDFYRNRCEYLKSASNLTEDWNVIKFSEK